MTRTFSEQADCCHGICKPQSTSMFDNQDCQIHIQHTFSTNQDATDYLTKLIAKAKDIESEACLIDYQINQEMSGHILNATFTFCCQAEMVIFNMALSRI